MSGDELFPQTYLPNPDLQEREIDTRSQFDRQWSSVFRRRISLHKASVRSGRYRSKNGMTRYRSTQRS